MLTGAGNEFKVLRVDKLLLSISDVSKETYEDWCRRSFSVDRLEIDSFNVDHIFQ